MALGHGSANQVDGVPLRSSLSPAVVALATPIAVSAGTINLTQISGTPIILGQNTKSASLPVVIASDQLPLSVTFGSFSFNHISTNTTTIVKSGSGILNSITINTAGAALNTATVYDNTAGSGTIIAIIDTTSKVSLQYNIAFTTGLTIVTATGTAADITVSYK